jgi:hypothetical protein
MPNWCNNTLNIRHEDPAMIERARKAFIDGRFLEEFVPFPNGEWDYNWCVNEWGTKWDVGANGGDGHYSEQDSNGIVFNFDSAWAPPTAAYTKLTDMGFEILAYYYEPGMAFCGKWEDGCDDYYDYGGMTSEQIAEELPDDLDETFGISEQVAEWEAEDEENIEIDLNDGIDNINE